MASAARPNYFVDFGSVVVASRHIVSFHREPADHLHGHRIVVCTESRTEPKLITIPFKTVDKLDETYEAALVQCRRENQQQ